MKAALVVLCGCLQMIRIIRTSIDTITDKQSKLHHFRAFRESTAPDMKRLKMMTKKTERNKRPLIIGHGNRASICRMTFNSEVKKITH